MSSVKTTFLTGVAAAAMAAGQAQAADYAPPPPPQQVIYQPVPVAQQEFGGWYLRGDIGMSNQKSKNLDYWRFAGAPGFTWLDEGGFDGAALFGLGIGYQYNDWLRFDLTGEYRAKTSFYALDRYDDTSGGYGSNEYRGSKREWVFLANAYLDLGTWWCITPFIGAGVGFANITLDHFTDTNVLAGGGGYAKSGTVTNFAWALHAGLAYKVTPNFTVELAYRYLNLGDAQTGVAYNLDGSTSNAVFTVKDLTSHDFKLGLRWNLQDTDFGMRPAAYLPPAPKPAYVQPQQVITMPAPQVYAPPPPPVYAAPQPQYAPPPPPPPAYMPPPAYTPPPPAHYQEQPPLMRRG